MNTYTFSGKVLPERANVNIIPPLKIEMEAKAAIDGLSGKAFKGQTIFVHEARPRGHR